MRLLLLSVGKSKEREPASLHDRYAQRLERLGVEVRLREAERDEVSLRLEEVGDAIDGTTRSIGVLADEQQERRRYLAFRLREIYKEGRERALRQFVGGESVERQWSGLNYASYLSERDGRVLREYRTAADRLRTEQQELLAMQAELKRADEELVVARRRAASARSST